jgi:hypothetical protein
MERYVVEFTERCTYECVVRASSKREAIQMVKECDYDTTDMMSSSMPFSVRVLRIKEERNDDNI